MKITSQLAKHIKDFYFGGNWTDSSLKGVLKDVNWQQATTKVASFNTIATLVFHLSYYVNAAIDVLQNKPLTAKDKYSFNHPPIQSQKDWDDFLSKKYNDAEILVDLVSKLPENKLWEDFSDNKYGNYYRNINGIIEHAHYHLGQIALIKKMITTKGI